MEVALRVSGNVFVNRTQVSKVVWYADHAFHTDIFEHLIQTRNKKLSFHQIRIHLVQQTDYIVPSLSG